MHKFFLEPLYLRMYLQNPRTLNKHFQLTKIVYIYGTEDIRNMCTSRKAKGSKLTKKLPHILISMVSTLKVFLN